MNSSCGSSPRARGTVHGTLELMREERFIPASAGNGFAARRVGGGKTVHPRERGERDEHLPEGGVDGRFIPASAGNGASCASHRRCGTVHPRERGEREGLAVLENLCTGSSPRARGTGIPQFRPAGWLRFIPASAGNGPTRLESAKNPTVHPRERGERHRSFQLHPADDGSSPRARGTVQSNNTQRGKRRFIPASAGNGPIGWPAAGRRTVHPRERGERAESKLMPSTIVGSSPRARGTVLKMRAWHRAMRFIPASAGNGTRLHASAPLCAVHPRERGERRVEARLVGHAVRFIPASAGNGNPRCCMKSTGCGSSPRARGTGDP